MSTEQKTYDMTRAVEIVRSSVPEDHSAKEKLMIRLDWCRKDISYRPPETQGISWGFFEDALITYLGVDMSIPWLDEMAKTLKSQIWHM